MLAQASRAASRLAVRQPALRLRALAAPTTAQTWRAYANYNKPNSAQRQHEHKQHGNTNSSTGAARQTSPGTGLPKDQTWKPKDSIAFGSAGAASQTSTSSGASSTQKAKSEAQTGEFNKHPDPAANTVPEGQPGPQAHAANPSNPTPGSSGQSEAANEEFRGPQSSEVNTKPSDPNEPETPKGPLPDLRQGIPSTFNLEFGSGKKTAGQDSATDAPGSEGGEFPGSGRPRRRQEGEEEEYDQSDYETSTDRQRQKLANYMYASIAIVAAIGGAYFGRPYDDDEEAPNGINPSDLEGWGPGAIWTRIKSRMTGSVEYYTEPTSRKLLPDMPPQQQFPYTLVLSLEDLLIHSEWSREHGWRTAKRPGVDYFIRYLSQYFELVIFTSVPSAMGEPVIRKLDPYRLIVWPLFREATKYENGKYIKDLAYLNRPLDKTLIIDTSADHVSNQPENAIVLPKWNGDPKDPHTKDLVALIPFLEYIAATSIPDVRKVITSFKDKDIPIEFARREAESRAEFNRSQGRDGSGRPKASLGGFLSSALGVKATPAPGSMVLPTSDPNTVQSVGEGMAQGKMLGDLIRERGQREYARLDEEIRKNGEKWLKEMEEEEKRLIEIQMKDMKKGWMGSFMGGGGAEKK